MGSLDLFSNTVIRERRLCFVLNAEVLLITIFLLVFCVNNVCMQASVLRVLHTFT